MPVDTSIYANANPPPPNPLAMAGQVASFQNAQNQNRLFQQEFAARQAVGQAYQGALDPATGQIDVNKLVAGVANNPAAAFKAGEVGQQALAQQTGQTALDAAKVDLYNKHVDTTTKVLTPLLAMGDNVSMPDVYRALGTLVSDKNSQINADNVGPLLSDIPKGPNGAPPSGADLNAWLTRKALQNENTRAALAQIKGTPTAISYGGGTAVVAPSAVTGQTNMLGNITNTLTPGENAARIPTFVGGQPGSVPQSAITDPTGHALGAPAASGASPLGTGHYPAQAAPGASGAASAGGPAGFVPSGPKLGAETRANATASGNVGQEMNLQQASQSVPAQKAALTNMLDDLQNFNPGKGAAATYNVKSFLQRNAPAIGAAFGVNPDNIASQESFGKLANQIQLAQEAQLTGTGTDAARSIIHGANPNVDLSKEGNINMIHMLQGNADALAALHNKWAAIKGQNPDADYGSFIADNAKNFDPRVFQAQYLSSADRAKLINSLTPQEKDAFVNTLKMARDSGFIGGLPGTQNAPQ